MRKINLENWARKSHFEFFKNMQSPHFSLTANVDVTKLVDHCAKSDTSFFAAMLYTLLEAANSVPEFRQRFRGNDVVEHENVHASQTVPIDNDRFAFCDVKYTNSWKKFNQKFNQELKEAQKQKQLVDHVAMDDSWIFFSCLPWVSFTSFKNPTNGKGDCTPRISWGKYFAEGTSLKVPVGIEVHHALVDGVHVGHFFNKLESLLEENTLIN